MLTVYATDTLLPLYQGACASPKCRIGGASVFAQTVAVYADRVVVADGLTNLFVDEKSAPDVHDIAMTLRVVEHLRPLFDQGVIQFIAGTNILCRKCGEHYDKSTEQVTNEVIKQLRADLVHDVFETQGQQFLMLQSRSVFTAADHPSSPTVAISQSQAKRLREGDAQLLETLVSQLVQRESEGLAFNVMGAARSGAVLATNARFDAVGLRVLDRGKHFEESVDLWEALRQIQLPWITDLTASQVVALREEAADALPAFRARLRQGLHGDSTDLDECAIQLAAELRDEALALEAELRGVKSPFVRAGVFAAGGVALTIYGLSTNDPRSILAGMSGLLSAAAHAHNIVHRTQVATAAAQQKPAHVMVVAKGLSAHHD